MRGALLLAVSTIAVACRPSEYRNPLDGTEYLAQVPQDELVGTWALSHDANASLQLRADRSCVSSALVTAYIQDCEQSYPAKDHPLGACRWTVEQERDRGQFVVTFQGRHDAWLSAGFGVFRNRRTGSLVLVGTCGSGDAYALWPVEDAAASRGRRTRG
jgi:hypothetical protein